MGLTQNYGIFAGVHEDALNDILLKYFAARPRYLHFGSPGFVPSTTAQATQIAAIPFPGVAGGIDWRVRFRPPVIDIHPDDVALPPELGLFDGQLSVGTGVHLCMACEDRREPEKKKKRKKKKDPKDERLDRGLPHGRADGPCFDAKIVAVAHFERVQAQGQDAGVIIVDDLEIVDIEPNGLESVLECLLLQVFRAALAEVEIPLRAFRVGAFSLVPAQGPRATDDRVKVYGTVV